MYLGQYEGKEIRITLKNGKNFEGKGEWYTQGIDSPNGIASICVGDYELYEDEIIEVIVLDSADAPLSAAPRLAFGE